MSTTKGLTNDLLKSKMKDAMVSRGGVLDLDTCVTPGIHCLNADTINHPGDWRFLYGFCEVFVRNNGVFQRCTAHLGQLLAVRESINGEWNPWNIYAPTQTS